MREIKLTDITREELWAKQRLSFTDIDYAVWERNKSMLHQFSKMNRNCTFVVDVYKCRYAYASPNFVDLLGYDAHAAGSGSRGHGRNGVGHVFFFVTAHLSSSARIMEARAGSSQMRAAVS